MSELGDRIRQARLETGLTQIELAREVGVSSEGVVSLWESGKRAPSHKRIKAVAIATKRDFVWFFQPGRQDAENLVRVSQLKQTVSLLLKQLEQTEQEADALELQLSRVLNGVSPTIAVLESTVDIPSSNLPAVYQAIVGIRSKARRFSKALVAEMEALEEQPIEVVFERLRHQLEEVVEVLSNGFRETESHVFSMESGVLNLLDLLKDEDGVEQAKQRARNWYDATVSHLDAVQRKHEEKARRKAEEEARHELWRQQRIAAGEDPDEPDFSGINL